jgi:hypothetical protein
MKPKRDEKQGDTKKDIKRDKRGHGSGTLIAMARSWKKII